MWIDLSEWVKNIRHYAPCNANQKVTPAKADLITI